MVICTHHSVCALSGQCDRAKPHEHSSSRCVCPETKLPVRCDGIPENGFIVVLSIDYYDKCGRHKEDHYFTTEELAMWAWDNCLRGGFPSDSIVTTDKRPLIATR